MTDTEAFVALNMLPHIGPVRVRKLLEVFGSPRRILEAGPRDLRGVQGIGDDIAESIASWRVPFRSGRGTGARGEVWRRDRHPERLRRIPALLREIHDPPIVLYVWGTLRDSPRYRRRRHAQTVTLCRRVREEARVPACLFGPHRRQRARQRNRHRGASSRARGKRQDDSRSRQRA